MPSKSIVVDDLIKAHQDKTVLEINGNMFESKLKGLTTENTKLIEELRIANFTIKELEAYSKKSDLVITGLSISSFAETASSTGASDASSFEQRQTEKFVFDLLTEKLNVELTSHDISAVHRLGKRKPDMSPPSVIIRFAYLKVRETVYKARKNLTNYKECRIFINERLTKNAANLFRKARNFFKDGRINRAWISGGILHVKKSTTQRAVQSRSRPNRHFLNFIVFVCYSKDLSRKSETSSLFFVFALTNFGATFDHMS